MATAYEELSKERQELGFYKDYLKQAKQQQEQQKLLTKPLEELVAGIHDENQRKQIIADVANNPPLLQSYVNDYVKKREEEAKKGENLEAIIDSAPQEGLAKSLYFIGPLENGKEYETLRMYNDILKLQGAIAQAQENKDEEKLNKFQGVIRKKITDYMLSDHYYDTSNETTKKFLEGYVKVMSQEVAQSVYGNLVNRAQKYVTAKENYDELKSYIKEDLKDEKQRLAFYNLAA